MFEARLPGHERLRLTERRRLASMPTYSMAVDHGGADLCMTCGTELGQDPYVAVWNDAEQDPNMGWTICLPCAGRALPAGMPLLDIRAVVR